MRVRWTADAADDLERICDYIAEDRPDSARRVAQSVVEHVGTLEAFPQLGRSGRVEGTRELAFPPLPFIAIYEVLESQGEVRVVRILHGAQQWPPG
jgi:addiction module RelE/StbE family toxin